MTGGYRCGQRQQASRDRAGYLLPLTSPRAATRKFATLISELLFPLLMKEKTNYTTVAKIAHAGINSKGYTSGRELFAFSGSVRP